MTEHRCIILILDGALHCSFIVLILLDLFFELELYTCILKISEIKWIGVGRLGAGGGWWNFALEPLVKGVEFILLGSQQQSSLCVPHFTVHM